ncbi:hypothetical protein [Streptococcus cristatus]|jgi:hypothetical protein|uniref:hypothetical protein n=1 Tax=Streptococcus cristatus TaxID=45634 RepID=UPI0006602A0A|nr:hypothetical protein [Streptococcus cristatus]
MLDKLNKTQTEYFKLLKSIRADLDVEDIGYHLDKIRNFWFKKRRLIEIASQYVFNKSDTYFYTATSRFNVESTDNNIFFVIGKYQIYDDPLLSYLEVIERKDTVLHFDTYLRKLKNKVIESIDDLLILLEKEIPNFYIVPLRFLNSCINENKIDVMPFIKNFFVEEIDFARLDEYDDVSSIVITEHISQVMFFEDDNPALSIKERIKQYRREFSDILPSNMNDIQLLQFVLFGYFSQAIDIFQTSSYFNVFPFFSSVVTFLNYNFLLMYIAYNSQDESMKEALKKSRFIFTIWCEYRKKEVSLSIEAIKSQALLIDFYRKIGMIYREIDALGTQESIAKEISACLDFLVE